MSENFAGWTGGAEEATGAAVTVAELPAEPWHGVAPSVAGLLPWPSLESLRRAELADRREAAEVAAAEEDRAFGSEGRGFAQSMCGTTLKEPQDVLAARRDAPDRDLAAWQLAKESGEVEILIDRSITSQAVIPPRREHREEPGLNYAAQRMIDERYEGAEFVRKLRVKYHGAAAVEAARSKVPDRAPVSRSAPVSAEMRDAEIERLVAMGYSYASAVWACTPAGERP